jgi:transposase InsO family protein
MTAQSAEREAHSDGAEWIPAGVVAELVGLDEKNVRRRCYAGKWDHRYVPGESGGRRLEVNLASLPEAAQSAWRMAQSDGGRNGGAGQVSAADSESAGRTEKDQLAARSAQETGSTRPEAAGSALDYAIAGGTGDREVPREASGAGAPAGLRDAQAGLTSNDKWLMATDRGREQAIQCFTVLQTWGGFVGSRDERGQRAQKTRAFIAYWNQTHPEGEWISKTTLYRWAAAFRDEGLPGLLRDAATGPDGQEIPPELREQFHGLYMTEHRRTVKTCRDIVQGELILARSPLVETLPSVASFHRYVKTIPLQARILARDGAEAYRRKCQPFLSRDYDQYRVMERWVSDHYNHKVWVYDGGAVFRPWLTMWLEVRSRLGVGWYIGDGPNINTVLASLASGVREYGAPEILWSDNGLEFSSPTVAGKSRRWRIGFDRPRVTALVKHLGASWHFSIPKEPQSRGIIERWFGVLLERFDKLFVSFCGRDISEKPEGLNALLTTPRALPSLDEFRTKFALYMKDVVNETPSQGQGMDGRSPRAVFASQPYAKRTATAEALALLFMPAQRDRGVTVGQNGIEAFGRQYGSIELAPYYGQKVFYRYDPANIGEIYVFSFPDERYLCTVARRDAAGVTADQYRRIRNEQKALKKMHKAYQVARETHAANPDPVAALAASVRYENAKAPQPPPPAARSSVIIPIARPLEAAAKLIKAEKKHQEKMAAIEAEVAPRVRRLVGDLSGDPAPAEDDGGEILRRFYQANKHREKAS